MTVSKNSTFLVCGWTVQWIVQACSVLIVGNIKYSADQVVRFF